MVDYYLHKEIIRMKIKVGDFSGSSDQGFPEAIQNALEKAPQHTHMEIIETRTSWSKEEEKRTFQVIVSTFAN